jgi:hypothetical protein
MPERGPHCPFLNKSDDRCSQHFHLDQLNYAFEHCFDRFITCPTYLERLVERRLRRNIATMEQDGLQRDDMRRDERDRGLSKVATNAATYTTSDIASATVEAERPLVQLTIAHRFRRFTSKAAAVSQSSGL